MPGKIIIRPGRKSDARFFVRLLAGLADFEHLEPPNPSARRRVIVDTFDKKLASLFVAVSHGKLVGYALFFYTYSTFLARPILFLEDIFVLKEYRGTGIGRALFMKCVKKAVEKGCGRMEWRVLKWNRRAVDFYERMRAARVRDWHTYRLDSQSLTRLSGIKNDAVS